MGWCGVGFQRDGEPVQTGTDGVCELFLGSGEPGDFVVDAAEGTAGLLVLRRWGSLGRTRSIFCWPLRRTFWVWEGFGLEIGMARIIFLEVEYFVKKLNMMGVLVHEHWKA